MKIKTCVPLKLPLPAIDWESLVDLIGKAHAVIARYDEITSRVENPRAVFSLITNEEALASVHSEKTVMTLEELLLYQTLGRKTSDELDKNKRQILHYRTALRDAAKAITTHPISLTIICKIHGTIKKNPKGVQKEIGRFRERQNWIGPEGCTIEEAYFYPPAVRILHKCMENLKSYLHYQEKDPLVQLAVFFAQLLIIHPFMDGNGRVARALIPLFLYKKDLTLFPLFYLSAYLKRHRLKYIETLFNLRTKNTWEEWIFFFLQGITKQGEAHIQKAKAILSLYDKFNKEVSDLPPAKGLIDALFASPILDLDKWQEDETAGKVLKRLKQKKWLVPYKKTSLFAVQDLLRLCD